MRLTPRSALLGLAVFCLGVCPTSTTSAETGPVFLWPGAAPGDQGEPGADTTLPMRPGDPTIRLTDVTRPSLTVFRPAPAVDTGAAVVVCPGGAYNALAYNKEGTEVAAWLNSIGVTGVVLKYRVPARKGRPRYAAPLQDAQRALGLVRQNARSWGIDPARVGVLGFSAGGHLAAALSTHEGERTYEPVDAADRLGCRPDFAVLVYPAYLVEPGPEHRLAAELKVTPRTPRTFLVQTEDDSVRAECSLFYYLALNEAKVAAELHVYAEGGHGYGLRPSPHEVSHWPELAAKWLKGLGVLEKTAP